MAFQKKYWYEFNSIDNKKNVVEIWQNTTDILVSEEIIPVIDPTPFSIDYPSTSKFEVIKSLGCELNLLETSDRKFFNSLYHADPKEIIVKHYINDNLNFLGYIDSEMTNETYEKSSNYPINITGNDGFILLERLNFVDDNGNFYNDIKSKFDLLLICLNRIGLSYLGIRINISTTFTGFSGSVSNTILHESYINSSNYYNEDPEPETLKTVLESILKPYGAFITQVGGYIYINDIHSLASSNSQTYKCYDLSGTYTGTYTESNNNISISGITYAGGGQVIEKSGGKNQQSVTYSPYPDSIICDTDISSFDDFNSIPTTYSSKNGYYYKTLTGNNNFIVSGPATFEASYYDNEDDAEVYVRWAKQTTHSKVLSCTIPNYYAISAGDIEQIGTRYKYIGISLKLTCEVKLTTKLNPYDDTEAEDYKDCSLKIALGISNTTITAGEYWVTHELQSSDTNMANKWVSFSVSIPLGYGRRTTSDKNGNLFFEIYSNVRTLSRNGYDDTPDAMKEIWLRNIKLEFVDADGNSIDKKEKVFKSKKNLFYVDEAESVDLICGTDIYKSDKGKIMKYDGSLYSAIKTWTRNGKTAKIEELLCVSLASNNNAGYITLSNMSLKNSFNHINIIYDNLISDKKFIISSLNRNYHRNESRCTLTEIISDDYNLVIE